MSGDYVVYDADSPDGPWREVWRGPAIQYSGNWFPTPRRYVRAGRAPSAYQRPWTTGSQETHSTPPPPPEPDR